MAIKNDKGIALIVAIVFAFIILALGSMALYISMQSTKISGSFKQYRSALDSAIGAFGETRKILGYIKTNSTISYPSNSLDNKTTTCLRYKLNTPTSNWTDSGLSGNQCRATTTTLAENVNTNNIKNYYDLKYSVGTYIVYVEIVNAAKGNTSSSSTSKKLTAGGVTTSKRGVNIIHSPTIPSLFRIEIVAESTKNSKDEAHISVVYGY